MAQLVALYDAVGWGAYTEDSATLGRALVNSSFVSSASEPDGRLLGLVRAISDDASICYVQDLLVPPDAQRQGLGRALLQAVRDRYPQVRQTVLITDDEPGQRAFYQALGLTEGAEVDSGPVRVFVDFRH